MKATETFQAGNITISRFTYKPSNTYVLPYDLGELNDFLSDLDWEIDGERIDNDPEYHDPRL